jgi:hypothetical protein
MESLDILILGVEASIALAGFAGIVATFQFSGEKETRRGDAAGLTMILQYSLLAALGCSIALLLYSFSVTETTLWAICSILFAIMHVWGSSTMFMNLGALDMPKSVRGLTVLWTVPSLVLFLIHVMNVSDIFFHREAGPVIASVIYTMCIVGFMFSRLLLRPIWRSVRIQEAAKLADVSSG